MPIYALDALSPQIAASAWVAPSASINATPPVGPGAPKKIHIVNANALAITAVSAMYSDTRCTTHTIKPAVIAIQITINQLPSAARNSTNELLS